MDEAAEAREACALGRGHTASVWRQQAGMRAVGYQRYKEGAGIEPGPPTEQILYQLSYVGMG